tara:strand:- start:414 stop:1424 length:1011 start_codon:yes stop_codon:yes gene_type:complete
MKHQFIANSWINGLLNRLDGLKVDLNRLSEMVPELDINGIQQGQRVDLVLYRQIWHAAQELTQDPLLGYKMGANLSLKGLGVLTPILMHSPTGRQSLENIIHYWSLLGDSIIFRLREAGESLVFECVPVTCPIKENSHHMVSLLTHLMAMSRWMGVKKNAVEKLCLPHDLDLEVLAQALQRPVEAAVQPPYSIWFNVDTLDEQIPGSDNHLYQLNKAYAEDLMLQRRRDNDLIESVKALIIETGYQKANADYVAQQFDLSKRGLQRLLSEQKTTFRDLKEEVLKERALLLVLRNETTTERISEELGYSEVSAFHRAFKLWFGVTRKDYANNPAIQF